VIDSHHTWHELPSQLVWSLDRANDVNEESVGHGTACYTFLAPSAPANAYALRNKRDSYRLGKIQLGRGKWQV
jgi:hypothetical protein